MESQPVLFVDDEPAVLDGLRRTFRRQFPVEIATSAAKALEMLSAGNKEYPVIVSDMDMPEMDGHQFLCLVRERWPDSIRVMLTGNAEQRTAVQAVNDADVFRFVNKPYDADDLRETIEQGFRQFHARRTELDLLENTLHACVETLSNVLARSNPGIFGHTKRLQRIASQIAAAAHCSQWSVSATALLSHIGCVGLDAEVLAKIAAGQRLSPSDRSVYVGHCETGYEMLCDIPRLEEVAGGVRYQLKYFDGSGHPLDATSGLEIPLAARVLRLAIDLDQLRREREPDAIVRSALQARSYRYDPDLLTAALQLHSGTRPSIKEVSIRDLPTGAIIAADVSTRGGVLLLCEGWELNESVCTHLRRVWENRQVDEFVKIRLD